MSATTFTEYPITAEVPRVMVRETEGKHSRWIELKDRVRTGWAWTKYAWDVTEPTRKGYGIIRDERSTFLSEDEVGERECLELFAQFEAVPARETKKRERAYGRYESKRNALDRRYRIRKHIVRAQHWWPVPVQLNAMMTQPAWEASLLGLGMSAIIVAHWTRKGLKSGECSEAVRPKSMPKPGVVTDRLIEEAWAQLPLAKHGELTLLDAVQETYDRDGWVVPVLLPGTLLVEEMEKFHGQFAKGLGNRRREVVRIVRDASQGEGFFWLRVYRSEPSARSLKASPLASVTETSVDAPIVLAEDELGNPRSINLGNSHIFLGGRTQMGKSATIEQICTWLLLDPEDDLAVLDLSGTIENYERLEPLSRYFLCGLGTDTIDQAFEFLMWLDAERGNRNRSSRPLYVLIDEIHELVKRHGKKAYDLLDRLGRNTLTKNIRFIIATQQPDSGSIPTGLLGQCHVRIGLPVRQSWVSDLIIDNGQERKINLAKLPQVPGYCVIDDEQGATQARIYPPDAAVLDAKIAAALAVRGGVVEKIDLRPAATPAGEESTAPSRNLLADIYATRLGDENGVWLDELPARLRRHDGAWEHVTSDWVRQNLDNIGIEARGIAKHCTVENRRRNLLGYHFDLQIRPALGGES